MGEKNFNCNYEKINTAVKFEVYNMCTEIKIINAKEPVGFMGEVVKKVVHFLNWKNICNCVKNSAFSQIKSSLLGYLPTNSSLHADDKIEDMDDIISSCSESTVKFSFKNHRNIDDKNLRQFVENFPQLEDLNLSGCTKLTNKCCQTLSDLCPNLTHLDVGSCQHISDEGLNLIGIGCPKLQKINISWCGKISKVGIKALGSLCTSLTAFVSKGCPKIGDEVVRELTCLCPKLQILNLFACEFLTDEGIKFICKNCPLLRFLCVSNCPLLTDDSLISMGRSLPNLKTLEVAQCAKFTDVGFKDLSQGCPLLEKLDLDSCILVTDNTLSAIAKRCVNIQILCLSHCEAISNRGIEAFSLCSSHLAVLELDNCPLLTGAIFNTIGKLPSVKRVELFDCPGVSCVAIWNFQHKRPDIRLLPKITEDDLKPQEPLSRSFFPPGLLFLLVMLGVLLLASWSCSVCLR